MARRFRPETTDRIASAYTGQPNVHSVSAWLYLEATSVGSRFIERPNYFQLVRITSGANLQYSRFMSGTTGQWTISGFPQDEWFHLLITHDATNNSNNAIFYVNGEVFSPTQVLVPTGSPNTGSGTLMIGNQITPFERPLHGAVAGLAIYNKILSESERSLLFRRKLPVLVANANLVLDMPFDGSSTADSKNSAATVDGTVVVDDPVLYSVLGPVLSDPTATSIAQTTATIGCTTDDATGTLYAVVTTSATQPSIAQIKAGQNHTGAAAVWAGDDDSLSVGANTFSVTGLTAGTQYYTYFVQNDGVDDSNVLAGSFQSATAAGSPAVLSSPGFSNVGGTTATVSVDTDKNTGTLYWFVSTSASPPSAANLKTGTGAARFGQTASINTGANNFSVTSLNYATAYYAHFIQNDGDGDSNIVSTTVFTTDAEPVEPEPPPPVEGDIAMPGTVTPAGMAAWMNEVNARLNALGTVPAGASVVLATDDQAVADANPDRTFIVIE
jgi:hypothetical protein